MHDLSKELFAYLTLLASLTRVGTGCSLWARERESVMRYQLWSLGYVDILTKDGERRLFVTEEGMAVLAEPGTMKVIA